MHKYFFVLGRIPEISLAELKALFPDNEWLVSGYIAIALFSKEIKAEELIKKIGGSLKIGEIIEESDLNDKKVLIDKIQEKTIKEAEENKKSGKFNFGFSLYGKQKISNDIFRLGLSLKKELKKKNISSRLVTSKEKTLSSVVVQQNNLITTGLELCLIKKEDKVLIGKTLAVQDFKSLSKRDFGRPKRDDHSGMIPPKLAQIMLNLARKKDENYQNKVLLDPFCGSGTILMEAFLMGWKNIIGTDISSKAIKDSRENLKWLSDKSYEIKIFESDVLNLKKEIKENSIDYIVCEPYLGPQRGFKDFSELVSELNLFYSNFLVVLNKILKKEGQIVMVWPQFKSKNKTYKLSPDIGAFRKNKNSLIYGREGQKVWREIVNLEK
jgi:tRNA G10  N-methylase Trm11